MCLTYVPSMVRAPGSVTTCRLNAVDPFGSWPDLHTPLCVYLQCANYKVESAKIAPPTEPSSPNLASTYAKVEHLKRAYSAVDLHCAPEYEMIPNPESEKSPVITAAQTHTPPEEGLVVPIPQAVDQVETTDEKKPKKHQGWPKGKPRGPRTSIPGGKKKKSTPKPKSAPVTVTMGGPDQLHSPQSLPAEKTVDVQNEKARRVSPSMSLSRKLTLHIRRHSFSNALATEFQTIDPIPTCLRSQSVPPENNNNNNNNNNDKNTTPMAHIFPPTGRSRRGKSKPAEQITVCDGCHASDSLTLIGEGEQWISCDGCKGWYHFVCAGFKSEREVRDVDKFYCPMCSPKYGHTTKVRKSGRAHTAVDYAGLNEGILKTSDDNPEHHYIAAFKNGDLDFTAESFARLPPELITAEFLEKSNGFNEPIVIPAALNPRPNFPGKEPSASIPSNAQIVDSVDQFGYEIVPDDGQDKLDMVIPAGLTVRRVSELYGPLERVPVIDVKAQEGEDKRWTMAKWADYYEQQGEKPVRNVISLEVSRSRLGRLIQRPKAVRDIDLQDSIWPEDDKHNAPPVQFYCLMSVSDCYTDFHIDFGGSSVFYHIIKGRKTFFFIPPTKQNLKKYEDWCLSPKMGHEFLGHQVKDCYRVDLYAGDTMLIPSGWIHAVWTPEDSLVIGGNFLTRIHYGMQIKVLEIEKNTKVAPKFRYPFFQKIMWLVLIKYLEEDRIPASVDQLLLQGGQFDRSVPIYCETDKFGHNSKSGLENYNARYYSKAELNGLPDLLNYIWRTVMISLGKVEGVTQTVRNAVTRSIPKGHGEPVTLARRFAVWIAWKRGNEAVPQWALPDAALPEAAEHGGDKKPTTVGERQSTRIKAIDPIEPSPPIEMESREQSAPAMSMTGFLRPSTDLTKQINAHMSTPKTSQLGPKRIACDACRKRRIRCKHKDEIVETKSANGSMNGAVISTIDLSGSLPISVKRRGSEADLAFGPPLSQSRVFDAAPIHAGPISADLSTDPFALKSGRVKACADCRKSKRRCIHDEHGNVDPVKASETPIPRGSASKKRRVSESDSASVNRKMKESSSHRDENMDGELYPRHSMQTPSHAGGSVELLDVMMYSPQDEASPQGSIPIDPALRSYNEDRGANLVVALEFPSHRDTIMTSIEDLVDDPMEDMVPSKPIEYPVPTVEPRTPGPPPHVAQHHPNGIGQGPSSPLSPLARSVSPVESRGTIRPPVPTITNPSKRSSHVAKASQTPRSASKATHTPKTTPGGRRRDSKETIKLEPGARNISPEDKKPEDVASLALAIQLQMEEHGLRRRSK
ncbi:hypothetical protein K504DRAFT_183784 [Pleomassaria siparia CBS 279.74]|uniref:JmjC domain-containing histone demethylation protein 1 n=1 Tax=Pleomassaria siparia CBS 279.74 TaxID=1314801 RepID=A0A6G1JS57_9PLEO|nr:hypothetical protein K504DRAFT_183784 [Pleomassaria siparia CBS 279.74]